MNDKSTTAGSTKYYLLPLLPIPHRNHLRFAHRRHAGCYAVSSSRLSCHWHGTSNAGKRSTREGSFPEAERAPVRSTVAHCNPEAGHPCELGPIVLLSSCAVGAKMLGVVSASRRIGYICSRTTPKCGHEGLRDVPIAHSRLCEKDVSAG